MNDRREQGGRSGRNGKDDLVHTDGESPVADAGRHGEVRPVSKDARSREFLHDRLNSSRNYAQFAAAAGADIFDGEPIERFAAVGKHDERTLRMRAQELRESIFADALRARVEHAGSTKRIEG